MSKRRRLPSQGGHCSRMSMDEPSMGDSQSLEEPSMGDPQSLAVGPLAASLLRLAELSHAAAVERRSLSH